MKTLRFSLLLGVAVALFALPAAAQSSKRMTPAENTICDEANFATPGLYGLCVAMCEAQTCKAEYDTNAETIVYDPSCSPSSDQLFDNYVKIYQQRGNPDRDPPVPPCVQLACPCWTELELDAIAGPSASCAPTLAQRTEMKQKNQPIKGIFLMGPSTDNRGWEWAFVSDDALRGFVCSSMEQNPYFERDHNISEVVYKGCLQSVVDECDARKR